MAFAEVDEVATEAAVEVGGAAVNVFEGIGGLVTLVCVDRCLDEG